MTRSALARLAGVAAALLLAACGGKTVCQGAPDGGGPQCCLPEPASVSTDEERWSQDLDYLENGLTTCHVKPFWKTSQADFQAAVATLHQSIPTMSREQRVVGLAQVAALIGDAHTELSLTQAATQFHRYPIQAYWFPDGLYVTRTTSDFSSLQQKKLTAINGASVDTVTAGLAPLISHENSEWLLSKGPAYLVKPEVLFALGFVPDASSAHLSIEDSTGAASESDLPAVDSSIINWVAEVDPPLYRQSTTLHYWYQFVPGTRILYLQYNQCYDDAYTPFANVAAEILQLIDANSVDKLVIDLRWNEGGEITLFAPLRDGIMARPSINQAGHLFAIIGRQTFSAAMDAAIDLKLNTNVVLVGEGTGGKPIHYGSVGQFSLPNSGLVVQYSTKLMEADTGYDNADSLMPDIEVEYTASDYFADHDPALEVIQAQ